MRNLFFILIAVFFTMSLSAQTPKKVNMNPALDYDNYIVPGIGYGVFMPRDWDTSGFFHGVTTEFTFYTVTRPAYKGPGYFRIYGRFNLMQGLDNPDTDLFTYSIGTNLSFEREIKRKAMIPFFGIELGGISRTDVGGSFQITPLAGINLVSTRRFNWYLQGGYSYATGGDFGTLSGAFANMGIAVMFW